MELHQLEYFVAVAKELSFTRGAQRLHVVQSAVSASIGRLERELGTALFDRTSRRITLTDAGAALLPEACATLAAAQSARDAVDQVRGGVRGTVTLGVMLTTGPIDLPALLSRFHAVHPHVAVRLRQSTAGSSENVRALRDGTLDLALVAVHERPPAGVEAHELATEELRLVCHPGHWLAGRDSVALDELGDETFVDFPPGWGNRRVVDHAFAAVGCDRNVLFEVANYGVAVGLVRHALGIAFLPESAAEPLPDLCTVTVTGHPLMWTMAIGTAHGRRLPAAARALLDAVLAETGGAPAA